MPGCTNGRADPGAQPDAARRRLALGVFAGLLACGAGLFAPGARAEGLSAERIDITQKGEFFQLSGQFDISLSSALHNALHRGVQLTFVQEVESERERSYWLAQGLTEQKRVIRLSYNALLRQYHVSVPGVSTAHAQLADALRAAGDLRDWAVLSARQMQKKAQYTFYVRMYLDTAQLPKPLQVVALASASRWRLDSGWQERSITY